MSGNPSALGSITCRNSDGKIEVRLSWCLRALRQTTFIIIIKANILSWLLQGSVAFCQFQSLFQQHRLWDDVDAAIVHEASRTETCGLLQRLPMLALIQDSIGWDTCICFLILLQKTQQPLNATRALL